MNNIRFENTSTKTSIQNLHIKNILALHVLNFWKLENIFIYVFLSVSNSLEPPLRKRHLFNDQKHIPWFTFHQLNCFIQFLSVSTVMVHC